MNALTTVGFTYDSGGLALRRDFELTTEISQGLITWRAGRVQIRLPNDASRAKLHVGNGQNLGYLGQHVSVDGVVVSNAEKRQETFAVSVAGSIEYSHSSGKQLLVEPAAWYIQGPDGVIKHDVMPHISSMDSRTFSLPILFRTDDKGTYFAAHNSALRPDPAYELVWGSWSVSVTLRSGADRWERRLRVDLNPSTPPAWTVLP
jgi:hypothetical protein